MQRYIDQLVEDLEEAAQRPPNPAFIEPPAHLEDEPVIAELALVPFKTIEELTGINHEFFPEMTDLNGTQCAMLNTSIFKVFESLNLELVDAPTNLPPEILYEVLITHWLCPVQYLPTSGMDLELCTGDPLTCPYGEFCNCGEEWEEQDHNDLHERFNEVIPQIAQAIDSGYTCYLNIDTLEFEKVSKSSSNEPGKYQSKFGLEPCNKDLKHLKWDKFSTIEPEDTTSIFNSMKFFTLGVEDSQLRNKLNDALECATPYQKFKAVINNSDQHDKWLEYKIKCTKTYIRKTIWEDLNNYPNDYQEEINGFYDDDGTKIDPESVPVPNLCVICKKHMADDWEENLLCLMNRNDQRNNEDFICGAFEKI